MNINNSIGSIGQKNLQAKKAYETANTNGDSFKSILAAGTQTQASAKATAPVRTDRIQFSHSIQQSSTLELSNLKSKIVTDLKAETKAEKLERISTQIERKEYKVDPYELAEIMFRL